MDENVVIKISGLQIVENTGDNVEVIAKGKHYLKKTSITYYMKNMKMTKTQRQAIWLSLTMILLKLQEKVR